MQRKTEHIVRLRAGGLCEYCRLPQSVSTLTFPLDHVIARQHGGQTTEANLAVACPECNLHKGPNIGGLEPTSRKFTRLFNPRTDEWCRHFRYKGGELIGLTAVGRTTIQVLNMNDLTLVALRTALMEDGVFPKHPKPKRRS